MTYNRDLQEDKERLFDTADTVYATTRLMAAMLQNTKVIAPPAIVPRATRSCWRPTWRIISCAKACVPAGAPHRGRGRGVGEELDKPLNLLTLAELKSVDKQFGRDALAVFDLQRAMAKRNQTGAPGTKEVAKQLARWRGSSVDQKIMEWISDDPIKRTTTLLFYVVLVITVVGVWFGRKRLALTIPCALIFCYRPS